MYAIFYFYFYFYFYFVTDNFSSFMQHTYGFHKVNDLVCYPAYDSKPPSIIEPRSGEPQYAQMWEFLRGRPTRRNYARNLCTLSSILLKLPIELW